VRDIAGALTALLAGALALYLKTKNFHWHVSGPHFRDYHLLLDEPTRSSRPPILLPRVSVRSRHDPALDRPRVAASAARSNELSLEEVFATGSVHIGRDGRSLHQRCHKPTRPFVGRSRT
jgi:hypothetical protein